MIYGPGNMLVYAGLDTVKLTDDLSALPSVVAGRNVPVKTVVQHTLPDLFAGSKMQALVGLAPGGAEKISAKLPHKLGLRRFSYCLKADPADDGVLVLDDHDRAKDKSFVELDSVGKTYWEFAVTNLQYVPAEGSGVPKPGPYRPCDEGCTAVLDTGAAFHALPVGFYKDLHTALLDVQDCSEIHK